MSQELQRVDQFRLLESLAIGADTKANRYRDSGDHAAKERSFAKKNQYLSRIIELGGATVVCDETCDPGMLSVTVQITGGRHHMPARGLSEAAEDQILTAGLC